MKSYLQELSENYDGTDDEPVSYYNQGTSVLPAASAVDMDIPRNRYLSALGYDDALEADAKANGAYTQQQRAKKAAMGSKTPVENYLAGVTDQSEYRSAMLQYLSAGGQKPKWYTGDFETDKPNIDVAIKATMTPIQQLQRQAQVENLESLQESRKAQTELRKQAQLDKVREQIAKREGVKAKPSEIIPTKNERVMADEALEGILGADVYEQLPPEQASDVARTVAARAKAKMQTPEGKGVDYESLVQDELRELIAKGELKKGKEGGWFGIGAEKPSFTRSAVPKPGETYKGYKYKGGDPSKPTSWEKS